MTEHTPKYLDLETETAMLEALARDLAAMPARIKRAREIAQEADDKAKERWAVNVPSSPGTRRALMSFRRASRRNIPRGSKKLRGAGPRLRSGSARLRPSGSGLRRGSGGLSNARPI